MTTSSGRKALEVWAGAKSRCHHTFADLCDRPLVGTPDARTPVVARRVVRPHRCQGPGYGARVAVLTARLVTRPDARRRQVRVGVVGREAHRVVQRQGRRVVAEHLEVRRGGARSAPHSRRAAMIVRARPRRRCSGATSMPRKPTQSSAYAAKPCADARDRRRREASVDGDQLTRGVVNAAEPRRTDATDASWNACRRRGSPAPSRGRQERALLRVAQHRGHRRLAERRVVRLARPRPRTARTRPRGTPAPSSPGVPSRSPTSATASPTARRAG